MTSSQTCLYSRLPTLVSFPSSPPGSFGNSWCLSMSSPAAASASGLCLLARVSPCLFVSSEKFQDADFHGSVPFLSQMAGNFRMTFSQTPVILNPLLLVVWEHHHSRFQSIGEGKHCMQQSQQHRKESFHTFKRVILIERSCNRHLSCHAHTSNCT